MSSRGRVGATEPGGVFDWASRDGILAAGSFVVDHVKTIDTWPDQDMLANITAETVSNGGGPYNVLTNLEALGAGFPLEAAGLLGKDANAHWIRGDCSARGIDITQLNQTNAASTSYTDAMCVARGGRRTFFHHRGTNSLFSHDDVDLTRSNARIFLLGYLLLLDAMDQVDNDGCTGASRLLAEARSLGFLTAVETVSAVDEGFRQVAIASLQHADFFFLNEVEASLILNRDIEPTGESMQSAVVEIATLGAPGRVILHSVQGTVCREPDGALITQPSLDLPPGHIRGSTGAGDAFTAGFLLGVHRGTETRTSLLQGVCSAAQSLTHPTASRGMGSLEECMVLSERFSFRTF
ncbi:MAG: carbohydrate kinase family protein [Actinomycetota bacterium]|nr:carbohydrate kinase family protein [Actinomycetota bacterium]